MINILIKIIALQVERQVGDKIVHKNLFEKSNAQLIDCLNVVSFLLLCII